MSPKPCPLRFLLSQREKEVYLPRCLCVHQETYDKVWYPSPWGSGMWGWCAGEWNNNITTDALRPPLLHYRSPQWAPLITLLPSSHNRSWSGTLELLYLLLHFPWAFPRVILFTSLTTSFTNITHHLTSLTYPQITKWYASVILISIPIDCNVYLTSKVYYTSFYVLHANKYKSYFVYKKNEYKL